MNIIRLYNQNRKQLFIVILIVAFIILAIHFVNYLVIEDNKKNLNNVESSSSTSSATTTYNPQQSAISSSTISDTAYKTQSEVIDNFIKYCNEGNSKEAYNLLSNDCKEVLFPTLEYFTNNYQNVIFSEDKMYTIKNWTGNTYKINITENILATGKSNNGIVTEDYFTIVKQDKEYKLNINGFIGRTNINKSNSNEILNIEVLYKDVYMDYVVYTLKSANKTDKTILLDSGESTQQMYLLDSNNVKHMSYRNEVTNAELKILPYAENTLQIKYASAYVSTRTIEWLVFNDIILDSNTYDKVNLKAEYKDRISIEIDL